MVSLLLLFWTGGYFIVFILTVTLAQSAKDKQLFLKVLLSN